MVAQNNVEENREVDAYVARSESWPDVIAALRPVLLSCGLSEGLKWGKPCYSIDDANIVIIQEMKKFLALMFFKGELMKDTDGLLDPNGPNSRSARRMCFTSVEDVERLAETVVGYIAEAVHVEEAGLEVGPPPALVLVEELQSRLDGDEALRVAFEALTPGRQREYHLHISGAKQAATRESRIDKYVPKILDGRGFRDR